MAPGARGSRSRSVAEYFSAKRMVVPPSGWQVFRKITLPMPRPALFLVLTLVAVFVTIGRLHQGVSPNPNKVTRPGSPKDRTRPMPDLVTVSTQTP